MDCVGDRASGKIVIAEHSTPSKISKIGRTDPQKSPPFKYEEIIERSASFFASFQNARDEESGQNKKRLYADPAELQDPLPMKGHDAQNA